MRIAPPLTMPGANLIARPVPPLSSAEAYSDGEFADLIQLGRRKAPTKADIASPIPPFVEADETIFAVETQIGDDAVRFDARPIVGPTGKPAGHRTPRPTIAPITHADKAPSRTAVSALVGELAKRLPVIAERILRDGNEMMAAAAATRQSTARGAVMATADIGASAPSRRSLAPIALRAEAVAASRHVPAQASLNENTLVTRVTALPREVVVVIRGVSLSAEESLSLAEQVREILAQHKLGDRMIRIIGTGGRA